MTASLSDQNLLSQDTGFIARVRQSMINTANTIKVENPQTVIFHRERETYAVAILNNPDNYKQLFANVLAGDANCSADATQANAASSFTATIAGTVMTVSAQASGTITVGSTISGAGISSPGPSVISFGTGAGGTGTYNLSASFTIATGETMTAGPTTLTSANAPAQAALVTDAHINSAVNNDFNSFFRTPAS